MRPPRVARHGSSLLAPGRFSLALRSRARFSRRARTALAFRRPFLAFGRRRNSEDRRGKIGPRRLCNPLTELLAQMPGLDFLHFAFGQVAKLERPIGDADQPVHLQPQMVEHVAHFAVLALADREGEPDIRTLRAVERGLDRAVADAVDRDAAPQRVEAAWVMRPCARTR